MVAFTTQGISNWLLAPPLDQWRVFNDSKSGLVPLALFDFCLFTPILTFFGARWGWTLSDPARCCRKRQAKAAIIEA